MKKRIFDEERKTQMVTPLTINPSLYSKHAYLSIKTGIKGIYKITKYETTLGKRNSKETPDLNLVPYTLYPWSISNFQAVIRFSPYNEQYTLIVESKNCINVNNEEYSTGSEIVLQDEYIISIKDIMIKFKIKPNYD